jgi:hypothetical protein
MRKLRKFFSLSAAAAGPTHEILRRGLRGVNRIGDELVERGV